MFFVFQGRGAPVPLGKKSQIPDEAFKQMQDEEKQLAFQKNQINSINNYQKDVVYVGAGTKTQSEVALSPLSRNPTSPNMPIIMDYIQYAPGEPARVDDAKIEFKVKSYDATKGVLKPEITVMSKFIPRDIAGNFVYDTKLNKYISTKDEKEFGSTDEIAGKIISDQVFEGSASHIIYSQTERGTVREGVRTYLTEEFQNADLSNIITIAPAYIKNKLSDYKEIVNADQQAQIVTNATNIAASYKPGYSKKLEEQGYTQTMASDDGAPGYTDYSLPKTYPGKTFSGYNSNWEKCEADVTWQNTGLAWGEKEQMTKRTGMQGYISLYYYSGFMKSEEGRKAIVGEIEKHMEVFEDVFIKQDFSKYPEYLRTGMQKYVEVANQAAQARGTDIQTSSKAVYEELGAIKEQIRVAKTDDAIYLARKAFFDFRLKYGLTRKYELVDKSSTPENIAAQYKTKNAVLGQIEQLEIAPEKVAGYLAMNLAMNYVGRGTTVVPPQKPIMDLQYFVNKEESLPLMGAQIGTADAHMGYSRVLWTVRVFTDSQVREEELSFSKMLVARAQEANLAADPKTDVYVHHEVKVKKGTDNNGRSYVDYVVEIRDPYELRTQKEVMVFKSEVYVPSSLDDNANPLKVFSMSAKIAGGSGSEEYDEGAPSRWGMQLTGALSAMPIPNSQYDPKALTLLVKNTGDEVHQQKRWESVKAIKDAMDIVGYEQGANTDEKAAKATAFWERYRLPSEMTGTARDYLVSAFGTYNSGSGLFEWKNFSADDVIKLSDEKMDEVIKATYHNQKHEELVAGHEVFKTLGITDPSFVDSLDKLNEWGGPLVRDMVKWTIRIAFLQAAYDACQDSGEKNKIGAYLMDAKGESVASPFNIIWPDASDAHKVNKKVYRTMEMAGLALKEHGLTFAISNGPDFVFEFTVTPNAISRPSTLGEYQGDLLSPVVEMPGLGMNVKLASAGGWFGNVMATVWSDVAGMKGSKFRVHAGLGQFLPSDFEKFAWESAFWESYHLIADNFYISPTDPRLSTKTTEEIRKDKGMFYYNAAMKLKVMFTSGDKKDTKGADLCTDLMRYCMPGSPTYDMTDEGEFQESLSALEAYLLNPMNGYSGGQKSNGRIETAGYNSFQKYKSSDNFALAQQFFGYVKMTFDYDFAAGKGWQCFTHVDIYPPPWAMTYVASKVSGEAAVWEAAKKKMPQFSENYIPTTVIDAALQKSFYLYKNMVLDTKFQAEVNSFAWQLDQVMGELILHSREAVPASMLVDFGWQTTDLNSKLRPFAKVSLQAYIDKPIEKLIGAEIGDIGLDASYKWGDMKENWSDNLWFGVKWRYSLPWFGKNVQPEFKDKKWRWQEDGKYIEPEPVVEAKEEKKFRADESSRAKNSDPGYVLYRNTDYSNVTVVELDGAGNQVRRNPATSIEMGAPIKEKEGKKPDQPPVEQPKEKKKRGPTKLK